MQKKEPSGLARGVWIMKVVNIPKLSIASFARIVPEEAWQRFQGQMAEGRHALAGRTVWNLNSNDSSGGVAELLRSLVGYANSVGADVRWGVVPGPPEFFAITKRLHNALHGSRGDGSPLGSKEQRYYRRILQSVTQDVVDKVNAGDLVILHDPQTAGLAAPLVEKGAKVVWRCHIGCDWTSPEVERGWDFLEPFLEPAEYLIYSRRAYVPKRFADRPIAVIPPSIDPFSPKNQDLDPETVRSILEVSGLIRSASSRKPAVFHRSHGSIAEVRRKAYLPDGASPPPPEAPLLLQVSRWDRLKDPVGVLAGFLRFVERSGDEQSHLMLAGPDVRGVADDPEGAEVLQEVTQLWRQLPNDFRSRIHLASLPMDDREENAAMVNALQRHATIVIQKSMQEGFGLTVSEAMWKGRPMVVSGVGGIQDQVVHQECGWVLQDPADREEYAAALEALLADPDTAAKYGRQARKRVRDHFLSIRSLAQFAQLLVGLQHATTMRWDDQG
ncbi:MAG: glycosyltransferase [Planctomycetota bacterium]|nr:MAG: glycosyltransferase [Planctomycetota bacterium]